MNLFLCPLDSSICCTTNVAEEPIILLHLPGFCKNYKTQSWQEDPIGKIFHIYSLSSNWFCLNNVSELQHKLYFTCYSSVLYIIRRDDAQITMVLLYIMIHKSETVKPKQTPGQASALPGKIMVRLHFLMRGTASICPSSYQFNQQSGFRTKKDVQKKNNNSTFLSLKKNSIYITDLAVFIFFFIN